MRESDLSEKQLGMLEITCIDFPNRINADEVKTMLKYVVGQLSDKGPVVIQMNCTASMELGERFTSEYQEIHDVRERVINPEISGNISWHRNPSISAQFILVPVRTELNIPLYDGLRFHVSDDDRFGQLSSESPEVMKMAGKYIDSYFVERNK